MLISWFLIFLVSDASGRYSSQFHFGNGFWLGSSTLCTELNGTEAETGRERIAGVGGAGVNGGDVPPYTVKFHVARMYLTFPSNIEPLVSYDVKVKDTFSFEKIA